MQQSLQHKYNAEQVAAWYRKKMEHKENRLHTLHNKLEHNLLHTRTCASQKNPKWCNTECHIIYNRFQYNIEAIIKWFKKYENVMQNCFQTSWWNFFCSILYYTAICSVWWCNLLRMIFEFVLHHVATVMLKIHCFCICSKSCFNLPWIILKRTFCHAACFSASSSIFYAALATFCSILPCSNSFRQEAFNGSSL